jgi:hypothetical protein
MVLRVNWFKPLTEPTETKQPLRLKHSKKEVSGHSALAVEIVGKSVVFLGYGKEKFLGQPYEPVELDILLFISKLAIIPLSVKGKVLSSEYP